MEKNENDTEGIKDASVGICAEERFNDFIEFYQIDIGDTDLQRLFDEVKLEYEFGFVTFEEPTIQSTDEEKCQLLFRGKFPCISGVKINGSEITIDNKKIANEGVYLYCEEICEITCKNTGINEFYGDTPECISLNFANCNLNIFYPEQYLNVRELIFSGCPLNSIDVQHNLQLEVLKLDRTLISEIDVSKNTLLKLLSIESTGILQLDVSANTELLELYICDSDVSSIDVTKLLLLELLDIGGTNVETIDLSHNKELKFLYMNETGVRELDLANCEKIEEISIKDSQMRHRNEFRLPKDHKCRITK